MTVRINDQIVSGTFPAAVQIGDIGFAPLGIDESLNLRRYLNGQVISQSLSSAFTAKVKAAIAIHSSLGTTEANWQSEKTLSKLGQCGKFVIDDENQTIRLPAVVNAQGLLGLSGIGTLVNESLPNITGTVSFVCVDKTQDNLGAFTRYIRETNVNKNTTTNGLENMVDLGFDASLSSSAYQNNAPVQQEAIQYPYYIQIATGTQEELPAIREYEVNTPFFFGQSKYSENAPYNASWLASNGQYNASSMYPDLWMQLTGVELNSSLNVGDTIEISGKTYVKRGLPVVLSTGNYTDYDFVVNQNDQTFRLPLLNGEEDLSGNTYEEITIKPSGSDYTASKNGAYSFVVGCTTTTTTGNAGILLQNKTAGNWDGDQITGVANYKVFSANIRVKKGDTVNLSYYNLGTINSQYFRFTPSVGNGTLYYYVGDTVQDASLINAAAVLNEVANLKARRYITETYKNGTEWYRIWSDGFIEQGGRKVADAGTGTVINFLKAFSDITYELVLTPGFSSAQNTFVVGWGANKTASSINIVNSASGSVAVHWVAYGF